MLSYSITGDHSLKIQGTTYSFIPTVRPGNRQLNGIGHFTFDSLELLQEHQDIINRVPLERAAEGQQSRRTELNVQPYVVNQLHRCLQATNKYAKVLRESNG